MTRILCIESATDICSVALAIDDALIALAEDNSKNAHASKITILIEEVLKKSGIEINKLDTVAVSKGPGSYTGLRIGISTAKGICFALGIPLIGVSTLKALTYFACQTSNVNHQTSFFVPMIDARRLEVYCEVFDENLNSVKPIAAEIIDEHSFSNFLQSSKTFFFGNGANKCKPIISHENAIFLDDINCSATNMIPFAFEAFQKKQFENVAYFEPFYLKDFVGTISKKNNIAG